MKCAHVVIGHNWLFYVPTCFACELAMGYIEIKLFVPICFCIIPQAR